MSEKGYTFWVGNYYWTIHGNSMSVFYYVRTHLINRLVSEYYYAETNLPRKYALID